MDVFLQMMNASNFKHDTSHEEYETKINNFNCWLQENGVEFNHLAIQRVKGSTMNGLFVDHNYKCGIKSGELCIKVPTTVILTTDMILQDTTIGKAMREDCMISVSPVLIIGLFLMDESRNHSSRWKPYIDILPKEFSLPFFFPKDQIQRLRGCTVYDELESVAKILVTQYNYIKSEWLPRNRKQTRIKDPSFQEFMWAISIALTRQNSLPISDSCESIGLVPGWDMANHAYGDMTTQYNPELKQSETVAMRDFKAGEEYLMCYGFRSYADFFLFSGFIPDTPFSGDYLKIKLRLANDETRKKKLDLLIKHQVCNCEFNTFKIKPNMDDSDVVFAFIHVMITPAREIKDPKSISDIQRSYCKKWLKLKLEIQRKLIENSINSHKECKEDIVTRYCKHEVQLLTEIIDSLY